VVLWIFGAVAEILSGGVLVSLEAQKNLRFCDLSVTISQRSTSGPLLRWTVAISIHGFKIRGSSCIRAQSSFHMYTHVHVYTSFTHV